jgi:chemotaxis protein histidine kinase CheA
MELSKKVGYIKGLMAGLKIDDSTPEGQVLTAMSDLLEEMAEEIEINAEIIDNITAYIDEIEDQCDCLDDIYADEYDYDPFDEDGYCCDECCDCDDDEDEDESVDELKELDALSETLEEKAAEEQEIDADTSDNSAENEAEAEKEVPPVINTHEEQRFALDPEPELEYSCSCPICGVTFGITQTQLDRGSVNCPGCGEFLEFE